METIRKLRFVLYPSVFILVFVLVGYCTFPANVVRELAEGSLTQAAAQIGPKNRGLPEVVVKDASLWRISGLNASGISVSWPPRKSEGPLILDIDYIKRRLGLFSLFTGRRSYFAAAKLYGGEISVDATLNPKTGLTYLSLDGTKINLAKMVFLEQLLGVPLQGMLDAMVTSSAKTEMAKDGTGSIKLTIDKLVAGPGGVKLPGESVVPTITVPQINLGKFTAEFALDKGQLESKTLSFTGGDLEADIKLSITVGRKTTSSRISGDGWFSIKRELVNTNETLKMLYDLLPALRAAQQSDGKVGIVIRGNLARPDISTQVYTGPRPGQT